VQAYRNIYETQSHAAREYATAVQDEQVACYTDVMHIGLTAEQQWRSAYETYAQELRAASAGDDAMPRATAAYRNLQREYERIRDEYQKAAEERYGRMTTALKTQSSSARLRMIDTWMDYLRALREDAGASPAAGKKDNS
jgi:hypothetical protein